MEVIQKNRFIVLILVAILFISCDDVTEFNQYKTLEDNFWKVGEKVEFIFEVNDTITPKNLFINIRNNNNYEFSNLYIITELKFPNNSIVIDTLQYEMTDVLGNFLGEGFSEMKENKLFYKESKIFPVSGTYTFNVRQAMRKNGEVNTIENLKGVQDVGFSIEKIK